MNDDDAEIVQAFLDESRENLDQLDRDLVDLEDRPTDPELLARVFRTVHTIKGTCGFLGFHQLEALTHAGESLLGALRSGELCLDASITTTLLRLVDAVRAALARIELDGTDEVDAPEALVAEIDKQRQRAGSQQAIDVAARVSPSEPGAGSPGAAAETSVRVDVALLDKLMDLVGELVLARGQIGSLARAQPDGPLTTPYRKLQLVTSELRDSVMRARLQTVGRVTGPLHRVARDLSEALGKLVQLDIDGEDVGVDKAVNEALRDPLIHLVRNAIDHGIEAPAERAVVGKPAAGHLRISAVHEGGRLQLEVSDDGAGVDSDRLLQRAIELGIVSAETAGELARPDVLRLMFHPGLSARTEVTSVSGRGVGMDVVRSNLDHVGGSIEVTSEPGLGTTFHISVPLTLSIMPAVIVSSGGHWYAIPQVDVREVVRLDRPAIAASIDDVAGARIHRLRGELLPLVDLADLLEVSQRRRDDVLEILVLHDHDATFGLIVDAVAGTSEVVVKPLTRATNRIPVFSGVTILADGRPSLILDVGGLAKRAGVERSPVGARAAAVAPEPAQPLTTSVLIASVGARRRVAVPLASVHRLERFPRDAVERAGRLDVIQYGDMLLPLLRAGELDDGAGDVQVVVCDTARGLVGVVVDHIDDVTACPATAARSDALSCAVASLVVDGRVTEMLDVAELAASMPIGATA